MRLGGPIPGEFEDPREFFAAAKALGYSSCYCPLQSDADDDKVAAFVAAADEVDVVIAEVGAWSNPISPDADERAKALDLCKRQLALAERVGARCCVNIAGGRGAKWDGPDPDNYSDATFDLIVETVREIIDAVKPTGTTYTLETMPWVPPDSPASYADLVKAIDRPGFGVHLDPVNMINGPRRYYGSAAFLRECFAALGPHIRSVHAKDVTMTDEFTCHISECRPGAGGMDYRTFLTEMARLPADMPIMLEHLPNADEYALAAEHVRKVAEEVGVSLTG